MERTKAKLFLELQREESPLMGEGFICIPECQYYSHEKEVLGCVAIVHYCSLSDGPTKLKAPCMNSDLLNSFLEEEEII